MSKEKKVFFTNEGAVYVDNEVTKGSDNLVTSGAVEKAIEGPSGAREIYYTELDSSISSDRDDRTSVAAGTYAAISAAKANGKLPVLVNKGEYFMPVEFGVVKYDDITHVTWRFHVFMRTDCRNINNYMVNETNVNIDSTDAVMVFDDDTALRLTYDRSVVIVRSSAGSMEYGDKLWNDRERCGIVEIEMSYLDWGMQSEDPMHPVGELAKLAAFHPNQNRYTFRSPVGPDGSYIEYVFLPSGHLVSCTKKYTQGMLDVMDTTDMPSDPVGVITSSLAGGRVPAVKSGSTGIPKPVTSTRTVVGVGTKYEFDSRMNETGKIWNTEVDENGAVTESVKCLKWAGETASDSGSNWHEISGSPGRYEIVVDLSNAAVAYSNTVYEYVLNGRDLSTVDRIVVKAPSGSKAKVVLSELTVASGQEIEVQVFGRTIVSGSLKVIKESGSYAVSVDANIGSVHRLDEDDYLYTPTLERMILLDNIDATLATANADNVLYDKLIAMIDRGIMPVIVLVSGSGYGVWEYYRFSLKEYYGGSPARYGLTFRALRGVSRSNPLREYSLYVIPGMDRVPVDIYNSKYEFSSLASAWSTDHHALCMALDDPYAVVDITVNSLHVTLRKAYDKAGSSSDPDFVPYRTQVYESLPIRSGADMYKTVKVEFEDSANTPTYTLVSW